LSEPIDPKDLKPWRPTREELDEMEANGLTFDDLIAEVERVVQEPGPPGTDP
jgi:hypothetical protein